jgi:hypothetical protein
MPEGVVSPTCMSQYERLACPRGYRMLNDSPRGGGEGIPGNVAELSLGKGLLGETCTQKSLSMTSNSACSEAVYYVAAWPIKHVLMT